MADQQNRKLQEREYRFYKEIQVKFCEVVDPLPLSDYLVASCLTENDVDIINAKFQTDGRSKAAGELLDRLRRRPNWMYNLLLACSHPELGLDHLCSYIKDKMTKLEIRITMRCNDGHNCAGISGSINDASEEVLTQQGQDEQSAIEKILAEFKSRVDPEDFVSYLTRLEEEDEEAVKCKQLQSGKRAAAEELVSRLRSNYKHWKDDLQKALKCKGSGLEDLGEKLSETEIDERDLQARIESLVSNADISTDEVTKKRKELVLEFARKHILQAESLDEVAKVMQSVKDFNASLKEVLEGFLILILAVNSIDTLEAIQRLYLGGVLVEVIRRDLLSDKRRHHILQIAQKIGAKDRDIDDSFFDSLDFDVEICPADFQFCYLNLKELVRPRPPVGFIHKMMSPDLKDLFQSVESALCVPKDTKQLSFAANLLKAVHSEEIASEIKLLSYRLDFIDGFEVLRDDDHGIICAFDVEIIFNKDHLGVVKRDSFQWNKLSAVLKNERILKVILVHSRSLRVVETKLRVYKEFEMLFQSKTLHLQHEYEDFDEIAKKSANAKVSSFQRTILFLVDSLSSEKLALIVLHAAEHSFSQLNVRKICCNEFITDGENVGTVHSDSYTCRLFLTVNRIKRTLVTSALQTICKSFGFEIWKDITIDIKTMYLNLCKDQRQLNIEFFDTLIDTITVETMSFLDSILQKSFAAGSFIGTFFFSVDVNSSFWRETVADEIHLIISKNQKKIVKKALLLVENMYEKTTEDLKNVDRNLETWKEKTKCMDIIELVSIWEKREAIRNLSGLGNHKSVLNLIAGIKNDKPTVKVFLSIDDQDAIGFIKDHPEIPKETNVEFVVVKSYKEQKDQAKAKNYPIDKNVREMLSKAIKNQGERIHAKHSSVVGLGIGNMDCNGQITPCIIIYCLDKDLVPFGEKPLPKTLEGFSCDIREDFIMFGGCFDCHEIAHPNPGCCIGLPSNGVGSAGFLAKTNEFGSETSGFLTAAHVAAENWTDLYYNNAFLSELEIDQYNREIVHPLLPNNNSGRIIGKVKESFCGNWGPERIGIDAAFVQNYEQDKAAYRELQPADESELDYGDQLIVLKKGGTTGKTFGRLVDGSYIPCVNPRLDDIAWRLGGFYYFERCFAVENISGPFFNPGDSGSGVFLTENEHPTKPLGIAFAKLEYGQITVVCRIDQVARAFNLRLYEIVEHMEA